MPTPEELGAQVEELRVQIYQLSHGRTSARGILLGNKRLLADANHFYMQAADGTTTQLDGGLSPVTFIVAANNAPAEIKDNTLYACSGSNDHVQIQAAIDALPTQGGTVKMIGSDFDLGAALTGHNGLNLIGEGRGATVVSMAGGLASSFMLDFDSHTDIRIAHMTLDKNRPNATDQGDTIEITDCTRVTIEDIYSREGTKHGIFVGGATGCTDVVIRNNFIYDSNSSGIRVQRGSKVTIEGNNVNTCDGNGIYVTTCNDVRVANNWVYNVTDEGIELGLEVDEATCNRFTVTGNLVDTFVNDGIYSSGCTNGSITGNLIDGGTSGNHGINVNAASSARCNVTVAGNSIFDVDTIGIRIKDADGSAVTGNNVQVTTGKTTTTGILMDALYSACTGNTVQSVDAEGFTTGIILQEEYCTATGNTILNATTGIYENAFAHGLVTGNRIEGAQWGVDVIAQSNNNHHNGNHIYIRERTGGEAVTDLACIRVGGANAVNNTFSDNYLGCAGATRGIYVLETTSADRNRYYRNWLRNAEGTAAQVFTLIGASSYAFGNKVVEGGVAPTPNPDALDLQLSDTDGDTKVQVEEGADDDTWRVDCAGNEELKCTDTQFTCNPNADFGAGADVTGNITVTGTVDGVDVAARDHTRLHAITDVLDHSATNWRMFYSDGSAHIIELALGIDGTFLQSSGAGSLPEFTALVAGDIPDISATYVAKALFDANTFLYAVDDNTPIVKTRAEVLALLSGEATAAFDWNGQDLANLGVIFLTEQAAAEADIAGKGQLWVKTATPNELWFTDDAGTDVQLGVGGGGGASTALDNLASVAINTSLISDTDSTDDLGSAAKYWANAYIDKLYLNATATLDGATAGRVNLTGSLQVSGTLGLGVAPTTSAWLYFNRPGTLTEDTQGINIAATGLVSNGNDRQFEAIAGIAAMAGASAATGQAVTGLNFQAGCSALNLTTTFSEITALLIEPSAACVCTTINTVLNVTNMRGVYLPKPTLNEAEYGGFTASIVIPNYDCIDIEDVAPDEAAITTLAGLRIDDMTLGTNNYILELGPTPYLRLLGSGSWTPADYETPLYLAGDDPAALYQVTLGAADSGGAGFRCLRVPNL